MIINRKKLNITNSQNTWHVVNNTCKSESYEIQIQKFQIILISPILLFQVNETHILYGEIFCSKHRD